MSKKIIALLLAASLAGASLAACGKDSGDTNDTSADDPIDSVKTATIEELHTAIKEAYGEEYLPNQPLDAEMLNNLYGIDPAWVSEFVAEMPMMITNVDTLIIVKPTEGNSENVLNALNSYYTYINEDSMQYPMNIEKVRAAQVFEKGGYVFFIMLGIIPDELIYAEYDEDMTDEEIIAAEAELATKQYDKAVENNKKATDAIDALLG